MSTSEGDCVSDKEGCACAHICKCVQVSGRVSVLKMVGNLIWQTRGQSLYIISVVEERHGTDLIRRNQRGADKRLMWKIKSCGWIKGSIVDCLAFVIKKPNRWRVLWSLYWAEKNTGCYTHWWPSESSPTSPIAQNLHIAEYMSLSHWLRTLKIR